MLRNRNADPLSRFMNPPLASRPDSAVLDAGALDRLRELDPSGRNGVVARVLETYESSLVRHLEELRAEQAAPRSVQVATIAHTLKSSSGAVGALAFAAGCESLERRVREGAAAQTHDVAELIALGEAALAAVRSMLRR
jgi:HPt (histidine-containing phosphotransfer) domain-containing protein